MGWSAASQQTRQCPRNRARVEPPRAAQDILSRREIVFRRGLLWPALLASMAIPGIYPAQRIGEYVLVDGGVLNPVP